MYVDMLSSALEAWEPDLSGEELVDHALECRVRMLATGTAHGASAYEALAAEVAYDRALICLCGYVGIVAGPADSINPTLRACVCEESLLDHGGRQPGRVAHPG